MSAANNQDFAILFVDDEDLARKYFDRAFARHWPVLTAPDVATAIDILDKEGERIAVLVTDQRMPGQLGVDLLRHARSHHPQIVRMLTTAYSELADAIEAVNRGEILRYITKPWDIKALEGELRHAFEFFQLRQERDALLHEKFSVRQRELHQARLRDLLVVIAGLNGLRQKEVAIEAFVDALIATVAPKSATVGEMEMFGLQVSETQRMSHVASMLCGLVNREPARRDDSYDAEAGFRSAAKESGVTLDISSDGSATILRGDTEMIQQAVTDLLRVVAVGVDAQVAFSKTENGALRADIGCGLPLADMLGEGLLDSVQQYPLLRAFLIAWHHGGRIELAEVDGHGRCSLLMPTEPVAGESPAPDAEWIEDLFLRVETWGRG